MVYLFFLGSNNLKLEDPNRKLSSYNGLINGSTVIMVILPSFVLYVTGLDGTMHEIEVPSSDPQVNCSNRIYFYAFIKRKYSREYQSAL